MASAGEAAWKKALDEQKRILDEKINGMRMQIEELKGSKASIVYKMDCKFFFLVYPVSG